MYIAGSLACLGLGAYFYTVMPSARPAPVADQSRNEAFAALAKQLAGKTDQDTNPASPPEATPPAIETNSSIVFAGDIMLGRYVGEVVKANGAGYPFLKIKDAVSSADEAIANLEGPLTKINNDPGNQMRFNFDPALAGELSSAGFDAVSLANNHALDQGAPGLSDTQADLKAAGLGYFGDPARADGPVYQFTADGKKIAVLGFQMVYGKLDSVGYAAAIAAAKKEADFVIVMPHWGTEYKHEANAIQINSAHAFIDAGADMIVGSHPHVVEGIEIYKNRPIFYSLGNLIFDQYFSKDTQEGLMLRLNFSGDQGSVDLLPLEIPKSQPVLVDGDKKAKTLQEVASLSDPALKDQILTGNINF